jgi:hypothetical protein
MEEPTNARPDRYQGGIAMLDYIAYVTAQREVRDLATSALPGAPIRPDREAPATPGRRRLRRRAARVLVRTAERLESGAVAAHRA